MPQYPFPTLPLNRPRRLAGHIVDHAVAALHLVDDARRHVRQEIVRPPTVAALYNAIPHAC
jgi:hypothetical protein